MEQIPGLYETEDVPLEEKIIHQVWRIEGIGFYWLIAELYERKRLAFGYANLNNDEMAEWGYFCLDELENNGATLDKTWKPKKFCEINLEEICSLK
jgi:hypothetical protein